MSCCFSSSVSSINFFHFSSSSSFYTSLEDEISVEEVMDDIGVKNTSLAIVLSGTMIYGEKNSYAFISKKDSSNKYVIYG